MNERTYRNFNSSYAVRGQSQKQRFLTEFCSNFSLNAGKTKPALQAYIFRTTTWFEMQRNEEL